MAMKYNKDKLIKIRNNKKEILKLIKNKDIDLLSYIDEFRKKESNKKIANNKYDIGIYTIGLSPYTTILSLSVIKPSEKVILIVTNENFGYSKIFIEYCKSINIKAEIVAKEIKYDSDTAEVFNIISKEIKNHPNKKIAIDITGGKKPAVAAGYLAASFHSNIDILYLNFSDYKNDMAEYGTEYLSILLNPNDIFGTVERRALEEMYLSKNFKGARRLSKEIERRLKKSSALLTEYKIEKQINEVKRIYYFSKLYELRNDFNYKDIKIGKDLLNTDEIEGIKKLSSFLNKVKDIEKYSVKDKKTIKIYEELNGSDEILYMTLERYNGALIMKNIDLQSYVIRLLSAVELAGIVLTKGQAKRVFNKIEGLEDRKLKGDLHGLRIFRNELNLNHGFSSMSIPDERYERAVLKYISITFNRSESNLKNIITNKLRYRSYKEIFN